MSQNPSAPIDNMETWFKTQKTQIAWCLWYVHKTSKCILLYRDATGAYKKALTE